MADHLLPNLERLLGLYEDAFRRHGDSPAAVLWPKGRQEDRFHALTTHVHDHDGFSVLDFGCGLGHLKEFLDRRYRNVAYTGADAVGSFIEQNRRKYPNATFFHVQSPEEIPGEYDYVIASGAFNILYSPDPAAHRALVYEILEELFRKAKRFLSFDMMTDAVDYCQPDAYHQNVLELYSFAFERLSRRLVLDQSYMPYEMTVTVWKDDRIVRPDNVFRAP